MTHQNHYRTVKITYMGWIKTYIGIYIYKYCIATYCAIFLGINIHLPATVLGFKPGLRTFSFDPKDTHPEKSPGFEDVS
jgi:hypothetical protein